MRFLAERATRIIRIAHKEIAVRIAYADWAFIPALIAVAASGLLVTIFFAGCVDMLCGADFIHGAPHGLGGI